MADDNNYYQQIAQIRANRAQQDVAARVQQVQEDLATYAQARDEAAREFHSSADPLTREQANETFHSYDRECQQLEYELAQFTPQQPQLSQKAANYLNQRQSYRQKYGAAADEAFLAAHEHALRAGCVPDSDNYYEFCDATLELNAPGYNGTRFDPTEIMLTPNGAAKAAGVTPDLYNRMRQKAINEGAFTKGAWSKKMG